MQQLKGKRVTVAGLGRFGGQIAVARWLIEQGAHVLVTDRDSASNLADSVQQLSDLPIEFRLGEHREEDFTSAYLIVASPAIPRSNPFLRCAAQHGVPITTEICLFTQRCPAPMVFGVTGTKGKSTTTAMLGQILRRRFTTFVGGNIGHSLLADLDKINREDAVVLELSSYMLDYLGEMQWRPRVALITMITADHLQWHGGRENYIAAKLNLIRHQRPDDFAVLNRDNDITRAMMAQAPGRAVSFGLNACRPFQMKLAGPHNQLNAQGAFAAASTVGITWNEAQEVLADFRGLPHRLELVHESGGVRYINDSIATIPEAAIAALMSFEPRKVIQIIGGYDKHLDMTALCQTLAARAKAVLCIGDLGPKLAQMVQSSPKNSANVHNCPDLPAAMTLARTLAREGDVILLSPGCTSYDQFTNFEQRGQTFARLSRAP